MKKYYLIRKKYYYTDNGWKSWQLSDKNPGADYVYEEDRDIIFNLKGFSSLGVDKTTVLKNEFEFINTKLEANGITPGTGDGYGSSFEVFAISVLTHKDYDYVISHYIVHGHLDGKVDAIVYDKEKGRDAVAYQIKMFQSVSQDNFSLMQTNINEFIETENITSDNSQHLLDFCKSKIGSDDIKFDFKTISADKNSESNYSSMEIINTFFKERICPMAYNYLSLVLPYTKSKDTYSKYNDAYVLFYSLEKLCKAIDKSINDDSNMFLRFFADNVRRYKNNSVEIEETLKSDKERKNFHLYNNGISICGEFDDPSDRNITITNPMVINGQQTLTTIYNKIYRIDKSTGENRLKDAYVPIFLKKISVSDRDLRYKVAKFNNRQNSIQETDFLSIDINVRNLQIGLLDYPKKKSGKVEYYLNIISSGTDDNLKLAKSIYKKNVINIKDFVRLLLVVNKPSEICMWKNSSNPKYDDKAKPALQGVDIAKAYKLCDAIHLYSTQLLTVPSTERLIYRAANLLIQYLVYNGKSISDAFDVAKTIAQNYNNEDYLPKLYTTKETFDKYFDLTTLSVIQPETDNANDQ